LGTRVTPLEIIEGGDPQPIHLEGRKSICFLRDGKIGKMEKETFILPNMGSPSK